METASAMAGFQSPVSEIPDDWDLTKFGYHFIESDERNGDNPPGPLLSISAYRGVEVNTRTDGQQPSLNISDYRVVRPGQLAANMMWLNHGGIGVSSETGYISPVYKAFWISSSFEPRYVHHLFRSSRYINYFSAIGTGVRPNSQMVTKTVLGATLVPIPPLADQRRIAEFLDRETSDIDAMVGKLDELTGTLKARRGSVALAAIVSSGESAPYASLQAIAQIVAGEAISSNHISNEGEFPVYGGNGIRGFTSSFNQGESRVLVGRQGALCGNVHLAPAKFWASEHALVLSPHKEVNLRWLAYAARSLDLGRLSTAAAQPGITASAAGREKVPYPSFDEQSRIADYLDEVTGKIDVMLTKVAELKALLTERRAALITDVVTGRKAIT